MCCVHTRQLCFMTIFGVVVVWVHTTHIYGHIYFFRFFKKRRSYWCAVCMRVWFLNVLSLCAMHSLASHMLPFVSCTFQRLIEVSRSSKSFNASSIFIPYCARHTHSYVKSLLIQRKINTCFDDGSVLCETYYAIERRASAVLSNWILILKFSFF